MCDLHDSRRSAGVVASYVEGIDGNNITGAYRDELGDFHGFLTTVPRTL